MSVLYVDVPPSFNAWDRWEFVTTLDFEWEVYTGRRPWRWSFIVYVSARLLALACIILSLVGFNLTRQFNCNVRVPAVPRRQEQAYPSSYTDLASLCTRMADLPRCALWIADDPFLVHSVVWGIFCLIPPCAPKVRALLFPLPFMRRGPDR